MSARKQTIIVLLALSVLVAVVLLGWQGVVLSNAEKGDLISDVISDLWRRFPFFAYAMGFVNGALAAHFGWPLRKFGMMRQEKR